MSLDKELQRDRKTARRSFSASLMSNTKWRSLLAAIDGARIDVGRMVVKFIDVDEEKAITAFHLHPPHAFVDTAEFGPIPLVSIEWLEFPKVYLESGRV